jgi:hypothetical protein
VAVNRATIWIAAAILAAAGPARAGVSGWQLSEVLPAGPGGDPQVRYVELSAPSGGCWFSTTRLDAYDAAGAALGSVAPLSQTTCFGADTYLVLGTAEAGQAYGFTPDHLQVPPLPAAAGQLCFASSATRYDCVRWGAVTAPVHGILGAGDDSSAPAPPAGMALARVATTYVVADDWALATPTPRGPNDGTPWDPPDAGVDAGPPADAGPPPDAVIDARPDDGGRPPDAADHRFLDLDPGGGACGCRTARPGGAWPLVLVVAAGLSRRTGRRRRRCRPRWRRPASSGR